MPFCETKDGTKLFYNDWGSTSAPPVVLISGWPFDADMWEYQAVNLAASGLRVIAYDRRGFGRSDQPWNGYDYDTLAGDLATLIEKLGLRAPSLVGFSMGGGEVVRYIARHGAARVKSAVLVSSVVPFLLKTPDHPEGVDRSVFDTMLADLKKDRPAFLASFGKKFFGAGLLTSPVSSDVLDWAKTVCLMASPKATLDCVRAFSETDFRAELQALTLPVLVIHGDADAVVSIDVSGRAAAAGIRGATLKEYAGAPHGLFVTEKDRLTEDLLGFLR
jgi:non-heme chloroperoxidase